MKICSIIRHAGAMVKIEIGYGLYGN